MEIVTGYAGKKHVTANKQGCMHMGLAGNGDYILQDGEMLRAEIITNNKIRIYDGDLVMQGRQAHIAPGSYEDVTISNGGQDVKRNDIIVARYAMNSDTGVESVTLVVVEGLPGSTAVDPELTSGDIRGGDTLHEMALYRVSLNGLTVETVERIAPVLPSLDSLNMDIAECFQSVSDGKSLIAAAITDKGIETAADATFDVMAGNIINISSTMKQVYLYTTWASNSTFTVTTQKQILILVAIRATFSGDKANTAFVRVKHNGTEIGRAYINKFENNGLLISLRNVAAGDTISTYDFSCEAEAKVTHYRFQIWGV